jgi:hypothetical protein
MDTKVASEVIAALIGGGIVGVGKAVRDRIPYQTVSRARARALKGHWEGTVQPVDKSAGAAPLPISFTFSAVAWKRVRADSKFISPDPVRGEVINDYKGGFYQHRYLLMDYRKRDRGINGCGAVLLELSADSRTLKGYFLGYSSHQAKLFVSEVTLVKKA